MTNADRRRFLRLLSGTAAAAALPDSIARAVAIPAQRRHGTIDDVEHIVVLVQENRSFDHYFGALRGVRGFDDPRAVRLPSGASVWEQPGVNGPVLPFRPAIPDLGLQFVKDLDHDWPSGHAAWNLGVYDQWVPNKGALTMAYMTRADIPYHYALADAFTICDAYHSSVMGPTDPNRYVLWTGWVGNDGQGGGPVVNNAEAGYGWTTFPERLEAAGVSWKIYQDAGTGLDAAGHWGWTADPYIGNYGDNALLYFNAYRTARAGEPLYEKARTGTRVAAGGTLFDDLLADVRHDRLPQVSWIAAPEAYSEHPNWPANYGAWYISNVLDALTSNPAVWAKTVLFITYDENDGFFDHVVPPSPAADGQGASTVDTRDEFYAGDAKNAAGPYGLGVRVPMLVVSPWSRGGWVNSQVFDHTSILQFIERRFGRTHPGLREANITPWRRAVCGDLTSAFDFGSTTSAAPVVLPNTAGYAPRDAQKHADVSPSPPAAQTMPRQEAGTRPSRALPYAMHVDGTVAGGGNAFKIDFANVGQAGVCLQVRSRPSGAAPRSYTVEAGRSIAGSWSAADLPGGAYDLSVHGPNGTFRRFQGLLNSSAAAVAVSVRPKPAERTLALSIANHGTAACAVRIGDADSGTVVRHRLSAGTEIHHDTALDTRHGWYDLTVDIEGERDRQVTHHRYAGHVETGVDGISDPAAGRRAPLSDA